MKQRQHLFLKWALVNILTVILMIALGLVYGGRIHGPSLVAIPIIGSIFAYASFLAGRICWRWNELSHSRDSLLHDARYLPHFAWVTQTVGILSTVLGFWLLLHGDDAGLHDRIQSGGGVALAGTFVGILMSLVLMTHHRMIEHDLEA